MYVGTVQHSTAQHRTAPHRTVQDRTVITVLHSTIQDRTGQDRIEQYRASMDMGVDMGAMGMAWAGMAWHGAEGRRDNPAQAAPHTQQSAAGARKSLQLSGAARARAWATQVAGTSPVADHGRVQSIFHLVVHRLCPRGRGRRACPSRPVRPEPVGAARRESSRASLPAEQTRIQVTIQLDFAIHS